MNIKASLADLYPFQGHPYKVVDDTAMAELVQSILRHGVLLPALVRPRVGGGYELISGHRRKRACEIAGLHSMPISVCEVDDDTAIILMVNSNLHREKLLPSEKAFAYKMQMEALKRKGVESASQVETPLRSDEKLAQAAGESRAQIQRYIRLTSLHKELLGMVDAGALALNTGVELSYLRPMEQEALCNVMGTRKVKPTLEMAKQMKQESQRHALTKVGMLAYFDEGHPKRQPSHLPYSKIQSYFPTSYTAEQIEQVILHLLEGWKKEQR